MLRNTDTEWGSIARSLHWLVALLIAVQLGLGWVAEDMDLSPTKLDLFVWHKSLGLTVLLLVVLRLGWRLSSPPPVPLTGSGRWETRLAQAGHWLLYVLMFAVPLSGWWIADTSRIPFRLYWLSPVPDFLAPDKAASTLAAEVHGVLTTLLAVVVTGHVLAALRHHWLLGNATLRRMLPFTTAEERRDA
ncbi:MAG: cytochrome b [Woeseiaceae bacterium]|nr:cytochrome b [Woeseiaceae bacterium]